MKLSNSSVPYWMRLATPWSLVEPSETGIDPHDEVETFTAGWSGASSTVRK